MVGRNIGFVEQASFKSSLELEWKRQEVMDGVMVVTGDR